MLTLASATEVPFLDLARQNASVKEAIVRDLEALIDSSAFTNGPAVGAFEEAFAAYVGVDWCVGTASGLDALRIALVAAGLEPGDEVVVPAMTFAATFEAVTQAGGVPVPADVRDDDYGLDAEAAAAVIGPRTRFLMPVHLYGQLVDVRALERAGATRHAQIIEDACQAHGASRDGVVAGGAGRAAAFSFYPGKNLGAFGDAGCLVTSDLEVARRARALREHGQTAKYRHELEGWTARLDTAQAAVLLHKLPLLDDWNAERRRIASFFSARLEGVGDLRLPAVAEGSNPVWHLYVVRTERRDALAGFLRERGIATGLHYPEPPHLSGAYEQLGYRRGNFPVAEALADEALSLPIFPGMTRDEQEAVVSGVSSFFHGG